MITNTPETLAWLMDEHQGSLGFTEQELQLSATEDSNPKVSAWKDPKYPDNEVSIAIDVARKEVVQQADMEIANFKAKLVEFKVAFPPTTPVQQSSHCLVENLMDYLFGPDSEIYWVFYKEIPIVQHHGHTLFTGCLSIFFQTSRFNISYSEVKSSQVADETIGLPFTFHSAPGFPTLDQYNAFWKQVAYCGLPENSGRGTTERTPGWVSFWSMVQDALNKMLRKLTIEGVTGKRLFVIDDDKVHFAYNHKTDRFGLKDQYHAADKRFGYVCHHQVHACSQMLSAIKFEAVGETCGTATKALIKESLMPAVGSSSHVKLTNTAFAVDRGYAVWPLLKWLVFQHGAAIETATVRRSVDWIMTFDRVYNKDQVELRRSGRRLTIRRDLQEKSNPRVCAHGYQDGNGKAVLGMSTQLTRNEFDFVLRREGDIRIYNDQRINNKQWYQFVCNNVDADFEEENALEETMHLHGRSEVIPLLWKNNHQGWFLMRSFSFTSSTINSLLTYINSLDSDSRRLVIRDEDAWSVVQEYFGSRKTVAGMTHDEAQGEDIASLVHGFAAQIRINDEEAILSLREQLSDHSLPTGLIRGLVKSFNGKANDTEPNLEANLATLLAAPHAHRQYKLQSFDQLLKQCRERMRNYSKTVQFVDDEGKTRRRNKEQLELILSLVEQDEKDQASGQSSELSPEDTVRLKLLQRVLTSSYLKRLDDTTQVEYTRRGHALEKQYARCLWDESNRAFQIEMACPRLAAIVSNGMVAKRDMVFVKDSDDFLALVKRNNEEPFSPDEVPTQLDDVAEYDIMPLEMKARLSPRTEQQQRAIQQSASEKFNIGDSKRKFFEVDSRDTDVLEEYIPDNKEAIQILHHAFCHGSDRAMLLSGDDHGKLIMGVTVNFHQDLLDAYEKVLKDLYAFVLVDFYIEERNMCPFNPVVERALNYMNTTRDELALLFSLWKCAHCDLLLPLPPIQRIVPKWISKWNAIKSGSDTMTKLLDMVPAVLPHDTSQAQVVARMLNLQLIVGLRCYQMCTSSNRPTESGCMRLYRNAASRRMTYKQFVTSASSALGKSSIGKRSNRRIVLDGMAGEGDSLHREDVYLQGNTQDNDLQTQQEEEESLLSPSDYCTPRQTQRKTRTTASVATVELVQPTSQTPKKRRIKDTRRNPHDNMREKPLPPLQVNPIVKQREGQCTGFMVERINPDPTVKRKNQGAGTVGTCALCGGRTRHYCLGCHRFLCYGWTKSREQHMMDSTGQGLEKQEVLHVGTTSKGHAIAANVTCAVLAHFPRIASSIQDMNDSCVPESQKDKGSED